MSRLLALVCLVALAASPVRAQEPSLPEVLVQAMDGKTVPAMGILVIRDGKVVGQAVRGVRRIGEPAPVVLSDRWNIGSDAKALTATLIGRLVEHGKLRWDTPLATMLPDLAADMRPEYRDVTLLELLSHRAGLPENTGDMTFFNTFYSDARPLPAQRLAYVKRALTEAPVGPARGESSYSNTGLILAGVIAEQVTGKPFEQLMRDEVFKPLGMTSADYSQAPGAGEPFGHVDGRVATTADANPQIITPAGGLRLALADWGRFAVDQMEGEQGRGKLFKAETYRLLHTPQGETIYALGWGVPPVIAGRQGPALTHGGSDGNWFAFICLFPGSENGVLVVANAADSMGGDAAAKAAFKAVVDTLAPPVATAP
jgi:CubicO group peptidase (beta-lactamase class C family)